MDKSKEKLVTDNMPFVGYMARKFLWTGIEYGELVAAGNLALVKAANGFDGSRSISFLAYARQCIKNEILMECRKLRKERMHVAASLDEKVHDSQNGDEPLFLLDMLPCEERGYRAVEDADWYTGLRKTAVLTESERRVLILLIGGYTQKAAGRKMGLSQSYVSRLAKKASRKLYGANLIERG